MWQELSQRNSELLELCKEATFEVQWLQCHFLRVTLERESFCNEVSKGSGTTTDAQGLIFACQEIVQEDLF